MGDLLIQGEECHVSNLVHRASTPRFNKHMKLNYKADVKDAVRDHKTLEICEVSGALRRSREDSHECNYIIIMEMTFNRPQTVQGRCGFWL